MTVPLVLALAAASLAGWPFRHSFSLASQAEVVAAITARCDRCHWGMRGREAAVLVLEVDGRYSQHLVLARGDAEADYRVALGPLPPGTHRLAARLDRRTTPAAARKVTIQRVAIEPVPEGSPAHRAMAFAPILHARPDTVGRFSDVPLLMWYEEEPTARGARLRYSVVFSNEDGGTPPDRLMATWGRLTDIEYVYGVELNAGGRVLAENYQGPKHEILTFRGRRLGRHPLLWVATDNNMLRDRGRGRRRYAPAPFPFDLREVSREAVMDAHPWTYRVMAQEARREGRVRDGARPGSGRIPDPRRYLYLEACGEMVDTALTFGLGVERDGGRVQWAESDGGQREFRIARNPDHFPNGCFRGAVRLPAGGGRLRALRFRAYTREPREGEPPLPVGAGRAVLRRVNRLFRLGDGDVPGPDLFRWQGELPLEVDGPPAELAIDPRVSPGA